MNQLLEAITIFSKYKFGDYDYGAEHDQLFIYVDPETVSEEDIARLEELSFHVDKSSECFYTFT